MGSVGSAAPEPANEEELVGASTGLGGAHREPGAPVSERPLLTDAPQRDDGQMPAAGLELDLKLQVCPAACRGPAPAAISDPQRESAVQPLVLGVKNILEFLLNVGAPICILFISIQYRSSRPPMARMDTESTRASHLALFTAPPNGGIMSPKIAFRDKTTA
jgi:hypothetical protein